MAMGKITSHEALALRWAELCNDPSLHDLPYKIELNKYGTMEMSPASTRHARFQAAVAHELARQLPAGTAMTECAVATIEGVRVPDVAWASPEFTARHGDATPLPQAPDICVEIRSPSNIDEEMAMKTRAYLSAGAVEVWIVADAGTCQVFDAQGAQPASRYGVQLALSVPAAR
jgi:Uma2 family endonuclease